MLKRKHFDYDLIIIGSGAGGSVGAHFAKSLGKKIAIFEADAIGGECPNFACVPTKALLYSAKVYQTVLDSKAYGVNVRDLDLDYSQVKKWKDLVVSRTGAAHGKESFEEDKIDIFIEKARFINSHQIEAGGKVYSSKFFLIATGSKVSVPPIEGLTNTGFITFKEAVSLEKKPKSLFILGAGAVGCEFAQIFQTFGSKVILADNSERLLMREDPEVGELIQALFEYRGTEVLMGINIQKVEKKGDKKIVHYQKGDHHFEKEVDEILVASGKRPNLDFDPEKAGIDATGGRLKVNMHLQTNIPNIFAAGDVVGPYLFTHTGYYQSYIAINNAFLRKKIKPDYSVVPRCVFTDPEIATVGMTEQQAKNEGIKTKKGIIAISILGRANTSNEFDGFIKILTDKKERIIGGSIVGPHAGEMIHEIALAVRLKVKAKVIADMLHAYPTFSEGIKIAAASIE